MHQVLGSFSNETIILIIKKLSAILISLDQQDLRIKDFDLEDFFIGHAEEDDKIYFLDVSKIYLDTHDSGK